MTIRMHKGRLTVISIFASATQYISEEKAHLGDCSQEGQQQGKAPVREHVWQGRHHSCSEIWQRLASLQPGRHQCSQGGSSDLVGMAVLLLAGAAAHHGDHLCTNWANPAVD